MAGKIIPKAFCCVLAVLCTYFAAYLRVIPTHHILFVAITSAYALFANSYIRRTGSSLPLQPLQPRSLAPMKHAARLLFPFTIVFSLSVPISLLFIAGKSPIDGSFTPAYRILSPHIFLTMTQILLETIGYTNSTVFTIYVRLGVTIAFVSYRIPVAFTWYEKAAQWAGSDEAALVPVYVTAITQAAAVLNIVFWSFALYCFLLLYCLPAVLKEPQPADPAEAQKTK